MVKTTTAERIRRSAVISVLVIEEVRHALPLAAALLKGGVEAIELTLRTPAAIDAARQIKKTFPEVILGIGTVLTTDQIDKITDIGADFAVSPGCNPRVIEHAQKNGIFFAPGIMSPTDIEMALEKGCRVLKYFPAETSGGLSHLNSMAAPYQHLDLEFIPLGGINFNNAREYLQSPLISAIGGSWIAKPQMIRDEDWGAITNNARQIRELIHEIRSKP